MKVTLESTDQVVEVSTAALNSQRKAVNGSRVLVLGVAYKPDIDDYRESPALDIIKLLQARGAEVSYSDPLVPDPIPELADVARQDLAPADLAGIDVAVVVTHHKNIDYPGILERVPLVVDTRNVYRDFDSPKIFRL